MELNLIIKTHTEGLLKLIVLVKDNISFQALTPAKKKDFSVFFVVKKELNTKIYLQKN